jgi:pimeloyl-ACP methyl ester carboxylesterase
MNRRTFVRLIGGAAAASTVAACAGRKLTAAPAGATIDAAGFHAARRFATTPSGKIAYVERGAGAVALFLHGFPLNGFQWRGALERLSPVRRCIAPDFLAMGYTEVAEGQRVDPAAQVTMLVAFLDALGIPQVDLVANDSGGAIAQLLVDRCPERIRTLLLTNCDVEVDSPPKALEPVIELSRQGRFADRWLGAWRRDPVLARSTAGIGGMCYADPSHPTDEAIETYFAPLLASGRRKALVHEYAIALARNPLVGIEFPLGCSTIPTRIVWGMADTIFSGASPDYLDRTVGNSRGVRRLHDSKLFWPEERPDILADEARTLWTTQGPRAS